MGCRESIFIGFMVLSTSENAANWPGGGHFRAKTAMTSLDGDFARWARLICRLLHTRVFVWCLVYGKPLARLEEGIDNFAALISSTMQSCSGTVSGRGGRVAALCLLCAL